MACLRTTLRRIINHSRASLGSTPNLNVDLACGRSLLGRQRIAFSVGQSLENSHDLVAVIRDVNRVRS